MKKVILLTMALSTMTMSAQAEEGRLLRFPSTNGSEVVFAYAGDIYKVSVRGGEA